MTAEGPFLFGLLLRGESRDGEHVHFHVPTVVFYFEMKITSFLEMGKMKMVP